VRRAAKVVLVPGDVVVGEEFGNDVVVEVVDVDPVASVVDALDNVKKSSSNRPPESCFFWNPFSRGRRARSAKTAKRAG
jgi:hypothetical protein